MTDLNKNLGVLEIAYAIHSEWTNGHYKRVAQRLAELDGGEAIAVFVHARDHFKDAKQRDLFSNWVLKLVDQDVTPDLVMGVGR